MFYYFIMSSSLFYCIIVLLFSSNIFILISKRFHIPIVISLITFGIILSLSSFKKFIIPHSNEITILGDIGLILLMFIAGVKSSDYFFYENLKDTTLISFISLSVSFTISFIVSKIWGFNNLISLIIALSLSVTGESVITKVLMENEMLTTDIGSLIMGSGLIDDIIGIVLFTIVLYKFSNEVVYKEYINLFLILSLFILGFVYKKNITNYNFYELFENSIMLLLVPFFFISMGLNIEISSKINLKLILSLIIIAIIGKVGGTILAKPFVKPNLEQLHLIGWGLNTRGGIGIALILIAVRNKLISKRLYSSLVMVILTTTLFFPILIKKLKKNEMYDIKHDKPKIKKEMGIH